MSIIKKLRISNLRNFENFLYEPSSRLNIIYGQNGSGKTSLLEAIYLLGTGRSFRTHLLNRVIRQNTPAFTLFSELSHEGQTQQLAIERHQTGEKQYRLNGQDCHSITQIAALLPIQFISTLSYQYFTEGPPIRRQFLDWGLFHVKRETFYPAWQRYQKALKQRNAALKQGIRLTELAYWDSELTLAGELIDRLRVEYIANFTKTFTRILNVLLPELQLSLRYQRGWSQEESLATVLERQRELDYRMGYTHAGLHKADLQLYYENIPADDFLSQGQQKLAAYALYLSQGLDASNNHEKSISYLIDDLPAELDSEKRSRLFSILNEINEQVFITGISEQDIDEISALPETHKIELLTRPS